MFLLRRSFACFVLFTIIVPLFCLTSALQGEVTRDGQDFVLDGVKFSPGSEIEVIGPIISSGHRLEMSAGEAALHGMWINGRASQDRIFFHLCRAKPGGWPAYKDFKSLKRYEFYKIRGHIIEGRINCARKAFTLVVKQMESVPSREIKLADLVDREIALEGIAVPGGIIKASEGEARIDQLTDWPESVLGKQVFVRGTLRKSQGTFQINALNWHPVDLDELVGKEVTLEGTISSDSKFKSFEYRKKYLYLEVPDELLWKYRGHFRDRRVRVSGKLILEDRPELNWNGPKRKNPKSPWYVIQEASLTFLEKMDGESEDGIPIYATLYTVSEGVPELIAECAHRGNCQVNRATVMYYIRRNEEMINRILSQATPETQNVLARRMNDEKQHRLVRLIYAAMLAHLNDKRGQAFLIESTRDHDIEKLPDALYCLGIVPSLGSRQSQDKTEIRWAEKPMIALMNSRELFDVSPYFGFGRSKEYSSTIADAVVLYSNIPDLMLRMNSPAAQRAIIDYMTSNKTSFWYGRTATMHINLYHRVQNTLPPIPAEDLKKMQQFQAELESLWK
ncbi:hypothetical protein [Gimesia panareensis]|uniref:hypothetical protein n=1 Tax=Gimesia panareensis TaxID=2527978 RepID=UPI001187AC24|nr:hypothetical protein [Gimesia panareensis]QDU47800.1 hypothetical protein Pan110_01100 [Gimesia panareensis]